MLPKEPPFEPDFLYQAQEGFYAYSTLRAAWGCNVFDHLQTPVTSDAIALSLGKNESVVRKMLEALMVLGLVQKKGAAFTNTPLAATYCVRTGPLYQGDMFRFLDTTYALPFLKQSKSLQPAPPPETMDTKLLELGAEAGIGFALPGTLRNTVNLIEELDCFHESCSFLDLAAGPGIYALALVERHPGIRATVFDLPAVAAQAKEVAERFGMRDKLHFASGNMMQGEPNGTYDIIFASDCLCMARTDLPGLLKNLREKLAPGGALVLRSTEVTRDEHSPRVNTLLEFGAALTGFGDYMFSPDEIPTALCKAGFSSIRQVRQWHMSHLYVIQIASR